MDINDILKGCWTRLSEYADTNEAISDIACCKCDKNFDVEESVWQGDSYETSDWFDHVFYCYDCAYYSSEEVQQQLVDKVNEIQMGSDA